MAKWLQSIILGASSGISLAEVWQYFQQISDSQKANKIVDAEWKLMIQLRANLDAVCSQIARRPKLIADQQRQASSGRAPVEFVGLLGSLDTNKRGLSRWTQVSGLSMDTSLMGSLGVSFPCEMLPADNTRVSLACVVCRPVSSLLFSSRLVLASRLV